MFPKKLAIIMLPTNLPCRLLCSSSCNNALNHSCISPNCPAAGFFFPECFLIAVLQSHALQAGGLAIDRLALAQVVLSSAPRPSCIESPPAVGVYVHGLYLEGAR